DRVEDLRGARHRPRPRAADRRRHRGARDRRHRGGGRPGSGGAGRLTDHAERLQHALEVAYRFLGRRDRTVAEVRGRLQTEEVAGDVIDAAIAELEEQGYLDDARYAERFAEDRRTLDAWGGERIERKLLAVGVAPVHIAAALGERGAAEELEAAVAVLRR